jgi:hypothetical protein
MDLASFLQDKKTPLLRPCLSHVISQFTGAQESDGILISPDKAHIHDDVMALRLVDVRLMDDFKDGCPGVLIPPRVPYLAGKFPLQILPYLTNLCLNGARHIHLLTTRAYPRFPCEGRVWESAGIGSTVEVNLDAALRNGAHAVTEAGTYSPAQRCTGGHMG